MNTRINRHPDAATLLSFAAGDLPEPLAAAVSAHAWMCGECRGELRDMELIGAALLDASAALGAADGRVATPGMPKELLTPERDSPGRKKVEDHLPAPIARRYGLAFDHIPWERLGPGVWQHRLALSPGVKGELYLLKLAAGCKLPVHGHVGSELTLVLAGAFADATGEYHRGDVQDLDDETEHQPVADRDLGCICLIASERPPRLRG
jgi:putative transcriptional regulator